MAKRCEVCGKGLVVGRQHSHANNVSSRRFEPNLQAVRAMINGGGKRIRRCTPCLPAQKGTKGAQKLKVRGHNSLMKKTLSRPHPPKATGPHLPAGPAG